MLTSPPNLKRVTALARGEDIGELDAMLIGLCDARQSVGHAEGDDARGDAGAGGVGSGSLKIAAPLDVDWLTEALAIWVVRPPTRKRSW